MKINLEFRVSGRVQGVGFRYATRQQAERLNLTGWVRNLSNGDVATAVYGDPDAVDEFGRWLWQGPEHARVKQVKSWKTDTSDYRDFRVLPNGVG